PIPLCFGALAVKRLDLGPLVPLTPRPLLVRRLRLSGATLAGAAQGEASARSNLSVDIAPKIRQTRL
ncbi:MAG: hypothetical protein IIY31_05325, partial [Desulfovibrio sp.]|nr:hypothetical protein [Desulfovibrio sp.]